MTALAVKTVAAFAAAYAALLLTSAALSTRPRIMLALLGAYMPSYFDGSEFKMAPRRNPTIGALSKLFFQAFIPRMFNVEKAILEAPDQLSACKQIILGIHPHGVLSLDHILTVSSFDPELERVAPQCRRSALGAGILFKIPFARELLLGLGCVDAGRKTADACLKAGLSLSVVLGGEREQLLAQRGPVENVVLRNRKGFVKLALSNGVPLVPLYCFGEAQLYNQSQLFMSFRSWLQRRFGIALVLPYGPCGLPGIPFKDRMRMVVGPPLEIPRIEAPTEAQVNEHHGRYCKELGNLFERHKGPAGYGHVRLNII